MTCRLFAPKFKSILLYVERYLSRPASCISVCLSSKFGFILTLSRLSLSLDTSHIRLICQLSQYQGQSLHFAWWSQAFLGLRRATVHKVIEDPSDSVCQCQNTDFSIESLGLDALHIMTLSIKKLWQKCNKSSLLELVEDWHWIYEDKSMVVHDLYRERKH